MNVLTIAVKEFIQGIRDKKNFLLMIFMPTILIIILSSVLKGEININKEIKDINVKFIGGKSEFKDINIDKIEESLGFIGVTVSYDILTNKYNKNKDIIISKNNYKEIDIYYDKEIEIEGSIVSNIIKSYTSSQIYKENNKKNLEYIEVNNIYNFKKKFLVNNYGISMIALTMLFSSVTGSYSIIKERSDGTLKKILTLPISIQEFVLGKFLGALIISTFQILLVIAISDNFLKINFGQNQSIIILILLIESSLAIAFGTFIGCFIKDNKSCWIILLSLIMIFGLIGGAFIPFNNMDVNVVKYISILSPITYINNSIFNIIYVQDMLLAKEVIGIFVLITILFLILSIKLLGGKNENISSSI